MADARTLLRLRREQERVAHPLADYDTGVLRCRACDAPVKNAAAWAGHLGAKQHRANLARVKQLAARAEPPQAPTADHRPSKRPAADAAGETAPKKPRVDSAVPADFFADPRRAIPTDDDDDEEEEEEEAPAPTTVAPPSALDAEWELFERTVLAPAAAAATDAAAERSESLARASVSAAPILAAELPAGFPAELQAPPPAADPEDPDSMRPPDDETPEQAARRRTREDRELIMDRILEEERVQEEADARVVALKARLELIKKQRAARAARS